jgi:RHS repeat-associated protein
LVVAATSPLTGELRYKAYGETRDGWGITDTTKYRFTGQREESPIGLYFYNARWYDAVLGRFAQADTVVPEPGNPQALNRYSYVNNNPLRYVDPTGHYIDEGNFCLQPGCSYDPSMEYYLLWMAGGAVRADTYHLTPAESKAIFGVAVPQRVSMDTVGRVNDPLNRGPALMAIAAGLTGMVANLPMPQANIEIGASSPQLSDIVGDPGPGPKSTGSSATVKGQSPNSIGRWGAQQVGQRDPVQVRQFRVAGGQRVYDGYKSSTDQYVEIKSTTRGVVGLNAHIRAQVAFDAAQETRPVWIFVNGMPTEGLQVELGKGAIPWKVLSVP